MNAMRGAGTHGYRLVGHCRSAEHRAPSLRRAAASDGSSACVISSEPAAKCLPSASNAFSAVSTCACFKLIEQGRSEVWPVLAIA